MSDNKPAAGDRFGEIAISMGVLTEEQLNAGLARQAELKTQSSDKRLGEVLFELKSIDLRTIQKVLLEQQRRRKAAESQASPTGKKFGEYVLESKLGEGGMGSVYKARDEHLGRVVALKVMTKSVANNREFVERFKREVKAAGQLNHINIVSAFGAGDVDGQPFLAMEFVDGESLGRRFRTLGRLVEREALRITKGVAAGLAHAHSQSFVHRDIKPDNVLLGHDGSIKIVDLGLAKALDDDQRLTKTGVAIGTPHYISPEQARGDKQIDHRCDIYSLGATLYLLLSGRLPFDGKNNSEIMLKHLKDELENPQDLAPELSDGVVAIVTRMMAKKPADRYDSCEQIIEDIDCVLEGKPLKHAKVEDDMEKSSILPPKKRVRRAPARAKAGGCLVLLVALPGVLCGVAWAAQWML